MQGKMLLFSPSGKLYIALKVLEWHVVTSF